MSTRMARHPNAERGSDAGGPAAAEAAKPNSGSAHISADATICFSRASTLTQRAGREANLIVIAHPNQSMLGRRFRVSAESPLEVGRSSEVALSFPDVPSISRRHARLVFNDGEVWLQDLGSRNGTFLNDEPVREQKLLASGDRFQVGTVVFKFLHEEDAENAYHEAIYNLVIRDGLTNVFNRRRFQEELDREFQRARRYTRPLALVLLDVDHFKRINDTWGHLAGDAVLVKLSKLSSSTVRVEDVFARYGGEEFCVICRGVSLSHAGILGERLRVAVEQAAFEHDGNRMPVTISVGVAAHPEIPVENASQLIAGADEALYQAKRTGRNRVLLKHGS
jgi:two-component system, cell cycle response regulator